MDGCNGREGRTKHTAGPGSFYLIWGECVLQGIATIRCPVRHYWIHIDRSDHKHWWQIQQARALFTTPYSTCAPHICRTIEQISLVHCVQCRAGGCDCGLAAYYVERHNASTSAQEHTVRPKMQEINQAARRRAKSELRAISRRKPQQACYRDILHTQHSLARTTSTTSTMSTSSM